MTNKEFFIQTWQSELKTTLGAIKSRPADKSKWAYRCHAKTRSTADIIGHMLPHAEVISNSTETGIADERSQPRQFRNTEDAAAYFEKWGTRVEQKLNVMDNTDWDEKIIDFQVDGNTFYKLPMGGFCWMLLFDIIHHRGQLSTYYRNMGVRNPNIYGPTAEDIEELMATKN